MSGANRKKNIEILREMIVGTRKEADVPASVLEYAENVKFCLSILLKGYPQATIIQMLEDERGIPYSTAWRLIRETEDLYGHQGEVDKRMKRLIASEMAQKAFEIAEGKGNARAMTAATNAFIKAWGLDRDDPDLPDFSKLDTPANILVIPDEVAEQLRGLPAGGAVNLNQLLDEIAEDAEYTDVEGSTEGGDSAPTS